MSYDELSTHNVVSKHQIDRRSILFNGKVLVTTLQKFW